MRTFFSTHWKSIVALVILVLLAVFTMTPGAAKPDLASRLRGHVDAMAGSEHNTVQPLEQQSAARHIESTLADEGYHVRRQEYQDGGQRVRNIEASLSNVARGARPDRIFIIGARYDPALAAPGASDNASGTAAVLELARLLRRMQPAHGTEVKFVFFVNEEPSWFMGEEMGSLHPAKQLQPDGQKAEEALTPETAGRYLEANGSQVLPPGLEHRYPDTGNFIAFVGSRESSALVRQALAAFRAGADFPAEGLAAPSYVEGVTLSDHSSYNRNGYPALMITDTAFLRYPYYHTAQDSDDKFDYPGIARVVKGLAHTIAALAGGKRT